MPSPTPFPHKVGPSAGDFIGLHGTPGNSKPEIVRRSCHIPRPDVPFATRISMERPGPGVSQLSDLETARGLPGNP